MIDVSAHDKRIKDAFDDIAAQRIALQKFGAWQQTLITELVQHYEAIISEYKLKCKALEGK